MKKIEYIDGGVCAPKGFKAGGVYCGVKNQAKKDGNESPSGKKNDLGMIAADDVCAAAAVFTTNKVKAAPVVLSMKSLEESNGMARAVIVNSGNANACNSDGMENALRMRGTAAEALGIPPEQVLVASTGVIGQSLNIKAIEEGIAPLVSSLSENGSESAAAAIMTTDTFKKEAAVEFHAGDKICRIGGIAKGSGMINPNMATMLGFITTDAAIEPKVLKSALSETTEKTFNRLSVDGDTSTNDTLIIMASGLAGNDEISLDGEDFEIFKSALFMVMRDLTKMLARDGEGATKLIECRCISADTPDTASKVSKTIISSPLIKAALFGKDANWGRVICAAGYSPAEFDASDIDIYIGSEAGEIQVCRQSAGLPFSEEKALEILSRDEIIITVSLNSGEASSTAWGCDLTYDYVKINGDYRT